MAEDHGASDDFGKDLGLMHEVVVTGRKVGAGRVFWATIAHSEEAFHVAVEAVKGFINKPTAFFRDMTKEGWALVEDVSDPEPTSVDALELITFLKGEQWISGEAMRDRAKELGANLGQYHAEFLLEHQAEIPRGWRDYYLVFPGTIWRDSDGDLSVPCLRWSGGQWHLRFGWLGGGWGSYVRLVRLRK